MKHATNTFAAIAATLALLATGCSVTENADILYSVTPPAHQLQVVFADNSFTDGQTITMTKTYADIGDNEAVTLKNTSATSSLVVKSMTISDTDHFTLSGFTADTAVGSAETTTTYISYSNAAAATTNATLTIVYTIDGKTRTLSATIKCTRVVSTDVALISVYDSTNTAIVNNNTTAYDFGYSESDSVTTITKSFTIKNTGSKTLTFTSLISNNEAAFSIASGPSTSTTLTSGESSTLTITRTNGKIAATATISIITNAENYSTFKLNLKSQDKQVGTLSVLDDSGAAVASTGYFDLGYTASGSVTRTFTIKNTGSGTLTLISVISGNDSSIAVSSAPTSGTILAAGATTTFALKQAAPSTTATAKITITTSDGANAFYVSGGGSAIPVTASNSFSYQLTGIGIDFASTTGAKTVTFTNNGNAPVVIASSSLSAGSIFADTTSYPVTIASGETGNLTVKYTPSSSTASDTAACTFTDKYSRTYTVNFTGTGYSQPTDLTTDTPALWLRADRISSSNTTTIDNTVRVSSWVDFRNNGLSADAVTYSGSLLRPAYNSSGINNQPSITFSGTSYTDCLKVNKDSGFIKSSSGTTTFVAFKTTTSIDGSRYIIQALNNLTGVFPYLYIDPRYVDLYDGYYSWASGSDQQKLPYTFATYASTAGSRWVINDNLSTPLSSNLLSGNTTYAVALSYDMAPLSPNPNMFMWINGTAKTLGFLFSQTYTTHPYADTSSNTKWGCYGYAVGNGLGIINPAIANADDYAFWLKANSVNHTYFYNRGDNTSNPIITTLYIGAASSFGGNFKGEIAEIIMYPTTLSDAKRNLVTNYLKTKYGAP